MTITNTLNSYKILNGGKKFVEVEEKLPLLTDEYLNRLKTTDGGLNQEMANMVDSSLTSRINVLLIRTNIRENRQRTYCLKELIRAVLKLVGM